MCRRTGLGSETWTRLIDRLPFLSVERVDLVIDVRDRRCVTELENAR